MSGGLQAVALDMFVVEMATSDVVARPSSKKRDGIERIRGLIQKVLVN